MPHRGRGGSGSGRVSPRIRLLRLREHVPASGRPRVRGHHHAQGREETFKFIKAETQLLYASDYPHWDFDLPSVIYDLPFLDERQKRNILGANAQKLFKLPKFEKKLALI